MIQVAGRSRTSSPSRLSVRARWGARHTAYPNLSQKERRNVIAMLQPAKDGDRPLVAAHGADTKSKL